MDWHCILIIKFIIDSELSRQQQVKKWRQLPEVNQLFTPKLFREDEKKLLP